MSDNERAMEILENRLDHHHDIREIDGAGRCIDFIVDDQSHYIFGKSEHTRENWNKGDTDTPNEAFRVRPPSVLKQLVEEGVLTFRGVNCVIYDHGQGRGDREFGLWLEYKFDADKVIEMENEGKLRRLTKDPTPY